MWAVGKTDMEALTIAGFVTNAMIAMGSFCLGFAVNIWVSYGGSQTLTPMGDFMFHKCTILAIGAAIAFYLVGLGFYLKKGSLWQTIKDESRQVTRQ
jgi:hypothetical protein